MVFKIMNDVSDITKEINRSPYDPRLRHIFGYGDAHDVQAAALQKKKTTNEGARPTCVPNKLSRQIVTADVATTRDVIKNSGPGLQVVVHTSVGPDILAVQILM
eukprot:SAG31_NODE_17945_length_652_cov_0.922242_1_plen_104_part_00